MFNNILLNVVLAAILVGIITGAFNFWAAKKSGETVSKRYIISIVVILIFYSGLFYFIQYNSNQKLALSKQAYSKQIAALNEEKELLVEEQKQQIKMLEDNYAKEMAFIQWKNRVFTSNNDLEKSLAAAQKDYNLTSAELKMWRGVAENNTLEKLIPKRNTKDVLKEYQTRLKKSLADIKSGDILLTSDIRVLCDNINTIRLIGKEYEKVLSSFKELYDSINASAASGTELEPPKQKKFLFFPVKQKEYEELLKQYYESKGNKIAISEISAKLKATIEKAEQEFKVINKKFEDNLSFLESTSNSITYNSEKLKNLIEAAISEAEIVSETEPVTNPPIKVTDKNTKN